MKKIFTLLAFLVVTVNAAAQQNTITYLDVSNSEDINTYFNNLNDNVSGDIGIIDNNLKRFNVTGYIVAYKKGTWAWVSDQSTLQNSISSNLSTVKTTWDSANPIFKGYNSFYLEKEAIYSTHSGYGNKTLIFNIKGCSGIDFFLYHNYNNTGIFSITATPSDGSSPVTITESLSTTDKYFPSIYDLDKSKSYTIALSIPYYTFLHEISFLVKDFRKYDITIGNSNWATMYLDYPVRIPENTQSDLEVYTIVGKDDDNRVCLSDVNSYIPANTGVLLHETTSHEQITFIETGKPLDPIDTNWLTGTTTALNKEDDNYGLGDGNYALTLGYNQGNLGFFVYKGETIGANKAFLVTDFAQSVKGFYLGDFGEFTDIQTVENEITETGNWYSLQGVRLNARPTQRGIYLNNGKKVFVK